jgi:hypothetical protein
MVARSLRVGLGYHCGLSRAAQGKEKLDRVFELLGLPQDLGTWRLVRAGEARRVESALLTLIEGANQETKALMP